MAGPPRAKKTGRVLFVGAALLVAVNFLILAGRNHPSDNPAALPLHITALLPNPQDVIRPQDDVGVQLDGDYQGQLSIDGQVVPDDQVTGDPNLGIIRFHPGCEGSHGNIPASECNMRTLPIGTITLHVDYWPKDETFEVAHQKSHLYSYSWQAKVG